MKGLVLFLLVTFMVSKPINADEVVTVIAPKVIVQAGRHSEINVSVEVKNGYHIQAHEVKDQFIVPTTLEINGSSEFIMGRQVFPSAKKFQLEGTDSYLDVYDGKFEIRTFFATRKQIQKGIYNLAGKLNYQACDSMRCLFPRTIEFSIDVEVQ